MVGGRFRSPGSGGGSRARAGRGTMPMAEGGPGALGFHRWDCGRKKNSPRAGMCRAASRAAGLGHPLAAPLTLDF